MTSGFDSEQEQEGLGRLSEGSERSDHDGEGVKEITSGVAALETPDLEDGEECER